jgi:MFS family permease
MSNSGILIPPSEEVRDDANPRRWKALAVLGLIQFMLVLDVTVVNVALPHIQRDLGFSRVGSRGWSTPMC